MIVKNVLIVFKFCDQYLIKTKQENEIALQLNKKLKYLTSFENPMNIEARTHNPKFRVMSLI
ncbi:hypothetical protein BGL86_00165 [Helicobacter pylori]|nr:hypothetical protein BGL86_00165 [Helicobacter pylori]